MNEVQCQWPSGECKIALVGEAPGTDEMILGKPFVGRSGKLLNSILAQVGIEREQCLVTNVFDFQLPGNKIKPLCVSKKEADKSEDYPQLQIPIDSGAYVPAEIAKPQLNRLQRELEKCKPNVIVALGGSAVWATLAHSPYGAMKKIRGTISAGLFGKTLVTYHPAYVLQNYAAKTRVVADLKKALTESKFPEIREMVIDVLIPKNLREVTNFLNRLRSPAAVDIETLQGQIDNIGFADCIYRAMSVPIFYPGTIPTQYWKTDEEEAKVITAIGRYLNNPNRIKVFQNGSYDVQWIWERWGIATYGWTEDTRMLHHALWPESPKDLGTIASIHLNMPGWKLAGAGRATTKKED